MEENVTIRPSIWTITHWWILSMVLAFFLPIWLGTMGWVIPLIFYTYKLIEVFCHSYTFDDNRGTITERKGVFSVHKVEIQYFRIKSIQVKKPFLMRLVGIGNIEVITSEPFMPFLRFHGVVSPDVWADFLQQAAKWWRSENGVKETDFHHF